LRLAAFGLGLIELRLEHVDGPELPEHKSKTERDHNHEESICPVIQPLHFLSFDRFACPID
jgi:hypothetical protein